MNDKKTFQEFLDGKVLPFIVESVKFVEKLRKDRRFISIADQLIRSSTSVGANIHEARGCSSRKEYARYFEHSLKSACETSYWFFLVTKIDQKMAIRAHALYRQSQEIEKILQSTISSLKRKSH